MQLLAVLAIQCCLEHSTRQLLLIPVPVHCTTSKTRHLHASSASIVAIPATSTQSASPAMQPPTTEPSILPHSSVIASLDTTTTSSIEPVYPACLSAIHAQMPQPALPVVPRSCGSSRRRIGAPAKILISMLVGSVLDVCTIV